MTSVRSGAAWWLGVSCRVLLLSVVSVGAASSALADAFFEEASRRSSATPGTRPGQDVLFPAVAAMDPPPKPIESLKDAVRAAMNIPGDSGWRSWEAWVLAEPQQAALEALETIADPDETYLIGLPYGSAGVPEEWADAGLVIPDAQPGVLAGLRTGHLVNRGLSPLLAAAWLDAARLAGEGDGEAAMARLIETLRLGRTLAERIFAAEKDEAMRIMSFACQRMRDLVYTFTDAFDAEVLRDATEALDERELLIMRIPTPHGERLMAEQIRERAFEERGGAKPAALADIMAASSSQPIRAFAAAAFWQDAARQHADWFDTGDRIEQVWADYDRRWLLPDIFDPLHLRPSDYELSDGRRFGVVRMAFMRVEFLFVARKQLLADVNGAASALAVVGYRARTGAWPPSLAAVQPRHIRALPTDPYNLDLRLNDLLAFRYFVPIRDQQFDRREDPAPHDVRFFAARTPGEESAFSSSVVTPDAPIALISMLPGIDAALIDRLQEVIANGEFSIDVLRGVMIDQMGRGRLTVSAARSFGDELKAQLGFDDDRRGGRRFRDGLFDEDEARERGKRLLLSPRFLYIYNELAAYPGLPVSDLADRIVDTYVAWVQTGAVRTLVERALGVDGNRRRGRGDDEEIRVRPEDIEAFVTATAEVILSEENFGFAVEFMASSAIFIQRFFGPKPAAAVDVRVDDTQFMLYSVGPDARDDLGTDARVDVIYWPPAVSVLREAGRLDPL